MGTPSRHEHEKYISRVRLLSSNRLHMLCPVILDDSGKILQIGHQRIVDTTRSRRKCFFQLETSQAVDQLQCLGQTEMPRSSPSVWDRAFHSVNRSSNHCFDANLHLLVMFDILFLGSGLAFGRRVLPLYVDEVIVNPSVDRVLQSTSHFLTDHPSQSSRSVHTASRAGCNVHEWHRQSAGTHLCTMRNSPASVLTPPAACTPCTFATWRPTSSNSHHKEKVQ